MFQTNFKLIYFILLTLVGGIISDEFNDLDNLGEQISESVNRDLAPLRDLRPRISAKVEEALEPLRSRQYYDQNVILGNRISANVHSKLLSFSNLGQHIQESFYQGLEPVRAMKLTFKMKDGIGGTTIATHLPEEFNDLDNLGERISESVNRDLAPLRDLGPRISAKVEEALEPLRTRQYYDQNVMLGNRISADVHSKLPSFSNLGQQIQESVYQGLEPVRAMELTFKMKDGIGGTTIATHLPEGKKFIIRNYQISVCSGAISDGNGECSGTLSPFQINSKQDYCYSKNGYSIINNYICIGANTVSVINNNIICQSNTETPALLLPLNEYSKLCKGISETVEYKYIANSNDPAHVEIPNKNKYIKCTNNEPGVCIFSESHSLPKYSGHTISINGQNVYSNN